MNSRLEGERGFKQDTNTYSCLQWPHFPSRPHLSTGRLAGLGVGLGVGLWVGFRVGFRVGRAVGGLRSGVGLGLPTMSFTSSSHWFFILLRSLPFKFLSGHHVLAVLAMLPSQIPTAWFAQFAFQSGPAWLFVAPLPGVQKSRITILMKQREEGGT